jgi:hypothetical protein
MCRSLIGPLIVNRILSSEIQTSHVLIYRYLKFFIRRLNAHVPQHRAFSLARSLHRVLSDRFGRAVCLLARR